MKKILISLLFILTIINLIYADTNGIWTETKDIKGGIFGADENPLNYTFNTPVYFLTNICLNRVCKNTWPVSFISPPLCDGDNKALGWDGSSWRCNTISTTSTTTTTTTCSNDCSTNTCSGSSLLTCSNYDSDSCLEYSASQPCTYGCSAGSCNLAPSSPPPWYQTNAGTFYTSNYNTDKTLGIYITVKDDGTITGGADQTWYSYNPTGMDCNYVQVYNNEDVKFTLETASATSPSCPVGDGLIYSRALALSYGLNIHRDAYTLLGNINAAGSFSGTWRDTIGAGASGAVSGSPINSNTLSLSFQDGSGNIITNVYLYK